MPHRSGDHAPPPPSQAGYNPHNAISMGGAPPPPPSAAAAVHMIHHPSDAARMAAYQRATTRGGSTSYTHHPHPTAMPTMGQHRMAPPPPPPSTMWHPADAAAHLARTEMGQQQQPPHYDAAATYVSPAQMDSTAFPHHRSFTTTTTTSRTTSMEETPEEAAASALLMASSAHTRTRKELLLDTTTSTNSMTTTTTTEEQQETTTTSLQEPREAPFKKRKKHLDVLRRNHQDESNEQLTVDPAAAPATTSSSPCHVSPGSASSSRDGGSEGGAGHHRRHTDEIVTIVTTPSSRTLLETSSGSYDTTKESPKVAAKDDALSSSSSSSHHFPTMLHKVLDETTVSSDVKSVLQWLPSGNAWKIVRWDALRRQVLPKHFPELCKGENGMGSMDSFLWHVRAWGFEEITDGDDAGAYRHVSFVRDDPKLCRNMTFTEGSPRTPVVKPTEGGSNKDSKSQESQSILQVPSLTSRSDGEQESNKQASTEHPRVQLTNSAPPPPNSSSGMHEQRVSPVYPGWQPGGMAMRYRTRDGGYADPRLVHQTSPVRHGVTFPPPYSPRFPFRTPGGPPSPLKSGRGGSRLLAASRNSFPVSQRGKGGAGSRSRMVRSPISSSSTLESPGAAKKELEESESSGLGPHLQKDSGATNTIISRKTNKRKLPLTRKAAEMQEEDRIAEAGTEAAASAEVNECS